MLILAVESSCDETAVALVRDGRELVTDQVFPRQTCTPFTAGSCRR